MKWWAVSQGGSHDARSQGELLDQRSNVMPEHMPPQRTSMGATPCQGLLCLLGVLVYLQRYHLTMLAKCKIPLCPETVKKGANWPDTVFVKCSAQKNHQSGERMCGFGNGNRKELKRVPLRRPQKCELLLIPEENVGITAISEFQNLPAPGCSQLFHFHHHCLVPPLDYQAITSHYETLNYFLETAFAVTCTNKLYNQSWQTQTFQHSWDLCCSSQVACLLFSLLLSRGQESTAQRPLTNRDLKTWISIPIFLLKKLTAEK